MEKAQLPDLGGDKPRPCCRHVEEARHTTPGSQAKGGGVRGLPLPSLSLLPEYTLLGLSLALPQHRSQRLGWGEAPAPHMAQTPDPIPSQA